MNTIATVYFCLAILPAFIHGNSGMEGEIPLLEELINAGDQSGIIDGIFKPAKNGFLGDGSCGFLYQGELLKPVRREVAMKFFPPRNKEFAEKEYSIYTYLEAINKPEAERYGIPSVYFYGTYRNYTMMALSQLDKEFNLVFNAFEFDIIDLFVTIQAFVRISKYIHYHGIQHKDLTFDNMMFRRSSGFIIDYSVSEKMYETKNMNISSAMFRENAKRLAKKDWQQFFLPMCFQVGIVFDLSKFGNNPTQNLRFIMEHLKLIEYPGLRRVYFEFSKHAFGGEIENHPSRTKGAGSHRGKAQMMPAQTSQKKPFYDQVNDIINEEIARLNVPKPILVSWVGKNDLKQAGLEVENIPNISSIEDRFLKTDAKYPDVDFDYFNELISASSPNNDKCSE